VANLLLVEYLHGVEVLGDLVLNEHDATERTRSQSPDPVEVVERSVILEDNKMHEYIYLSIVCSLCAMAMWQKVKHIRG